MYTVTR